MAENLDEVLKKAESLIKQADERVIYAEKSPGMPVATWEYIKGIHLATKALYEQNKVIIGLLRDSLKK